MKESASVHIAVIGDVVASRQHASRAALQRGLQSALDEVNEQIIAVQPLEPTIGDEFQAVYNSVDAAVRASLLVRLWLPEQIDARFGIGVGRLQVVGASDYGLTQDGPAWWAARAAVDYVASRQRRIRGLRTWLLVADDIDPGEHRAEVVNGYLLCRDQLASRFDGRDRRIGAGVLAGRALTAIAADEKVSTSAISQRYRRGIAAVVESTQMMA